MATEHGHDGARLLNDVHSRRDQRTDRRRRFNRAGRDDRAFFDLPGVLELGRAGVDRPRLANEFAEGKLLKKNVIVSQDAGWGKFQSQRSVWIVRKGESVKVFSGVCPPRLFGQRARREIYLRLPQQRVERRRRDAGRADSARA